MMSECCGGKNTLKSFRVKRPELKSQLRPLGLCPWPGPHPAPSSNISGHHPYLTGAVRQTHRVSQDLGTQHAHPGNTRAPVTLPALCLHLLTTRSSCEPWSHPEDLSVNPAQPLPRDSAASENSLGPPGRPPLVQGRVEHPGPLTMRMATKQASVVFQSPLPRRALPTTTPVEDEAPAQLHAPCVVEREGTRRSQKLPGEVQPGLTPANSPGTWPSPGDPGPRGWGTSEG